ncbi:MAG TPA: diaminopimelate epimerase [Haliangium sp.]|nr:diaminopimelate epimerase [Haliangium sp.]
MDFSKYHGLGNDFIVVDLRAGAGEVPAPGVVRELCDRRHGIGADGVLPILPATGDADARMRVLNADGSEAEMCGNGLRCVIKHLWERDPVLAGRAQARGGTLRIETGAGVLGCQAHVRHGHVEAVTVDMGRPQLDRAAIPMTGPAGERCIEAPLAVAGVSLAVTAVSMGNPHAVAFVDATGPALRALAEAVGPTIEHLDWFPRRTNAELAHVRSPTEIELVVWERGCGITLACGTGACATAVAACLTGRARAGTEMSVHLPGGALGITVAEDHRRVWMRGPAVRVFDGSVSAP